jgi:hypothetical protein
MFPVVSPNYNGVYAPDLTGHRPGGVLRKPGDRAGERLLFIDWTLNTLLVILASNSPTAQAVRRAIIIRISKQN